MRTTTIGTGGMRNVSFVGIVAFVAASVALASQAQERPKPCPELFKPPNPLQILYDASDDVCFESVCGLEDYVTRTKTSMCNGCNTEADCNAHACDLPETSESSDTTPLVDCVSLTSNGVSYSN